MSATPGERACPTCGSTLPERWQGYCSDAWHVAAPGEQERRRLLALSRELYTEAGDSAFPDAGEDDYTEVIEADSAESQLAAERCPTCGSAWPRIRYRVGWGLDAKPCPDPFHDQADESGQAEGRIAEQRWAWDEWRNDEEAQAEGSEE